MAPQNGVVQPNSINTSVIAHCVSLYSSVVDKVYRSKIKDDKKFKTALDNDRWRFEELPRTVQQRRAAGKGLSKDELERLVQWKITHGVNRPFLPGMVRKNESGAVQEHTAQAFQELSLLTDSSAAVLREHVQKALDGVCKLQGVGPATGTLILSVFDPVRVPFFQDEMALWLCPDLLGAKLKYNVKEYFSLFEEVHSLVKKLSVQAVEVEKTAFVLAHLDVLEDEEKKRLDEVLKEARHSVVKAEDVGVELEVKQSNAVPAAKSKKRELAGKIPQTTKRAAGGSVAQDSNENGHQQSRRSKRKKTQHS